MPTPPLTRKLAEEVCQLVADCIADGFYYREKTEAGQRSAIQEANRRSGIATTTLSGRLQSSEQRYNLTPECYLRNGEVKDDDTLPDGFEVLRKHAAANTQYIQKARGGFTRIIPVRPEPFAVAFIGDPHLDNKGCDLEQLQKDLALLAANNIRTVSMGDILDNFQWTGRLASKQAANRMSDKEGLGLARWFIAESGVRWDGFIHGNHDAWPGLPMAVLFEEWARPARIYDWIVRLIYQWEGGRFSVLAAHDFKGHSIHNPLHGLMRRAAEDGQDDLYVAGHRHTAAEGSFENGFREKRYHFARVAGYKAWDDYAHRMGFPQQTEGASTLAVINPLTETMSGRCRTFPEIADGVDYLNAVKAMPR